MPLLAEERHSTNTAFEADGQLFSKNYKGSNYRYAWPDAIQIKGSVCHSNSVGLMVQRLYVTAAMSTVFGSTLTLPTLLFFYLLFFRLECYLLQVGVRLGYAWLALA